MSKRFNRRWTTVASFSVGLGCALAAAVTIQEEIPASAIKVTASTVSSAAQSAQHLVNGAGMSGERHDNHGRAKTMWLSAAKPPPSRPATGLPESPAWVRFDFAQPQAFSELGIWNHNQANLTDRGFRKARLHTSADGVTWTTQAIEIPQAQGAPDEPCSLAVKSTGQPVKSVIIAAESNYGSDCYGLSAVKFYLSREVEETELLVPKALECVVHTSYTYRAAGKAGREITVAIKGAKLYSAAKLDVDYAGAKETMAIPANPHGTASWTVFLPAGAVEAKPVEAKLTLRTARTTLQQTVTVPPARQWTVYILMHSHVDIGFTDIQPNIAKKQVRNITRTLELIRENKNLPPGAKFKWNLEVFWPAYEFYKVASPEQKQAFEQAVRDGWIGVDAMFGNLLTGVCRGEELIRQLAFATDFGRHCGVTVDSMQISDVPGLTWGLVPALAQAGVKYISDGPNSSDRIGWSRVTWENKPFWWIGPDGTSKVLYWAPYMGYSFGHTIDKITDTVMADLRNLEATGYPYDMVQIRWSKGDNGSADERVIQEVRDWNAKYAYPKLVIATTSEMFHEFEKRYGEKLPTFRGDFTPYWEDGVGSSSRETALNRHSADRLLQAETLWALLNPSQYPAAEFDTAWKNIALYNEHTWGAYDSVHKPDLPAVKEQWKYKQSYALNADDGSRKLLSQILPAGDSQRLDVFNTASWPRTDLVTLPKETKGDVVRDGQGQAVPSQRLSTGELVFLAKDVPAFGAKRFAVESGKTKSIGNAKADGLTLTTPVLAVKLDATTGDIISLRRTGLDVELANGSINNYIYLPGGNIKDAKPSGPATISVKERGPLVASLLVESDAPGCNKLTREIRVVDGLDRVEIGDLVDKKAVRTIEGVHFGFSFNVPDPVVHVNSPGAVGEIEKDQLPGACKNWYSVERWADISNAKYGVTWSTADAPLMEVGGLTANLPWKQMKPNAYMKTITPSALIYSWIMNNHWHLNYKADQDGLTLFRYAIRPHAGYDSVAAMRFGVESTMPLIAAPAAGKAPGTLVKIEPAGVLATALKPSDDGKAWIVRLFSASGKDEQATLDWTEPKPVRVTFSDASELPGKAAGQRIPVPAWGLVTLRVDRPD